MGQRVAIGSFAFLPVCPEFPHPLWGWLPLTGRCAPGDAFIPVTRSE